MSKPILFDTISRSKFNELSDEIKAKKNYLIKEGDDKGTISKHIASLLVDEGADLPEVSACDSGKVLSVDESGHWVAAEPQGGDTGNQLKTVIMWATKDSETEKYRYFSSCNIDTVNSYLNGDNMFRVRVSFYDYETEELIGQRYGYVNGIINVNDSDSYTFNIFGKSQNNDAYFTIWNGHYELIPFDQWK